jgi:quercetin dioxygenase-like cupin family protein
MVYILDGEAEITIGEAKTIVKKGETIVMPAHVPHALLATEQFKMLLIVVFSLS